MEKSGENKGIWSWLDVGSFPGHWIFCRLVDFYDLVSRRVLGLHSEFPSLRIWNEHNIVAEI